MQPQEREPGSAASYDRGILDLLVTQGRLTPEQVQQIEFACTRPGARIDELLVESKLISPAELDTCMAEVADHERWRDSSEAGQVPQRRRDAPPGERFGRYLLEEVIGRGGMGVVYRAWDDQLCRRVALKTVRADVLSEEARARFAVEARAAAGLQHEGIVPVFDVGEHEDTSYLTMGFVEGHPLSDEPRPMAAERAVRIIRDVAAALGHAHGCEIVHRDVKPANILLDAGDRPLVTDFGLALRLADDVATPRITQDGSLLGTPAYMSPEQARGENAEVGPATDVFALGVVLFELVSGELPFKGRTFPELIKSINTVEPPSLIGLSRTSGSGRVPVDLELIVRKCLEKEPGRRYPSGVELAADLNRFMVGEPILARPSGLVYRSIRRAQRNRVATLATVLALVATVASAVVVARAARQARINRTITAEREVARAAARDSFDRGVLALSRGADLSAAIALFDQALANDPQLIEAMVERGKARNRAFDHEGALADLDAAIELDDGQLKAHYLRARLMMEELGDPDAARESFAAMTRVEEASGGAPSDLTVLGQAWVAMLDGDFARAHELIEGVQTRLQDDPDLHLLLARLHEEKSDFHDLERSLAGYEKAQSLDPLLVTAFIESSAIRLERGDSTGALRDLDQAIALNPQRSDSFLRRASARLAAGDIEAAAADAEVYLARDADSPRGYMLDAEIRLARGDHHGAVEQIDQAVALNPDSLVSYWERSRIFAQLGRFEEAVADLDRVLARAKRAPMPRAVRGVCLADLGRHAEAVVDLRAFLEMVGRGHIETQSEVRARLGECQLLLAADAPGTAPETAAAALARGRKMLEDASPAAAAELASRSLAALDSGELEVVGVATVAALLLAQLAADALYEQAEFASCRDAFIRALAIADDLLEADGKSHETERFAAVLAYDGACAASLAGDLEGAFPLLERARELGFDEMLTVDQDPDLRAMRLDARWPLLRSSW